jgi:hypothetical protein
MEGDDDDDSSEHDEDNYGSAAGENKPLPTKVVQPKADTVLDGVTIPVGQRACGLCNVKGHNSRTCEKKMEILKSQLSGCRPNTNKKMEPEVIRVYGDCGQIKGHNARTCK